MNQGCDWMKAFIKRIRILRSPHRTSGVDACLLGLMKEHAVDAKTRTVVHVLFMIFHCQSRV